MSDEHTAVRPRVDLLDPTQLKLVTELGDAWREIRRCGIAATVRDRLYGSGPDALEAAQVDALDLLVQRDAWRMSDLAEALRVDPSTATRSVQRLVTAGLVERRTADDDGRVVMVSIAAHGRHVYEAMNWRRGRMVATILERFEPTERPLIVETMQRFVAALDDVVGDLR